MTEAWNRVGPGDLVEVGLPLEAAWPVIVADALRSGAAILPVDARLTEPERARIRARGRPTHAMDGPRDIRPVDGGAPVDASVAAVVATSGTEGEPKLAELTRDALDAAVSASAARIGEGPWLACLPPAHIGGLLVMVRAILAGTAVRVIEEFDTLAVSESAEGSYVSLVPTMLARLLDADADLARFEAILVGGAGLAPDLAARAGAAGANVVRTYGQTESCGGVVYDGLPLDGVQVRVDGGEVQLAGPTLMLGYRLDPGATAAAFTTDGWLRTGDAGTIGDDGRLRVRGRIDDRIVTGGENVWPGEVEAVLRDHPAVADVAVAGAADPEWGHRVVAFVVPAEAGAPPSLEDLRGFARDRLAPFKLPRQVVAVEALPRTAGGKLRRRSLPRAPS
jgi:O-succinylbenzoic acid--CoA ligase